MKHLSRSIVAFTLVCSLGAGLAGCSSDDDADTSSATTAAPAADDAAATKDTLVEDTSTDDASDDSASSDAVDDVCGLITPDEVAAIAGGPVTVEEQPGGGCTFSQEDPRLASIAFNTSTASDDTDGTFNEARYGAFATITDPTKEEPGVGDYSAVASGTFGGGENEQGIGLVQVGLTIVQVGVVQANGIDGAAVRAMTTQALELAAGKL